MAAYCIFHESMLVSMGELFMCLGTFILKFYFHKANKAVQSDTGTSKARPPGRLLLHSQHWNTNTFTYFWWLNIYYRLCCPTSAQPCQTHWTRQKGDIACWSRHQRGQYMMLLYFSGSLLPRLPLKMTSPAQDGRTIFWLNRCAVRGNVRDIVETEKNVCLAHRTPINT